MSQRIAIFCGANPGHQGIYKTATLELATTLVNNQIGVVYGGGNIGLMGILADEVMRLGGEVIGVIPTKLKELEVGHDQITQLHVVDTMHERKAMMADLADGFIALPGGIGTLEEIIEVFTWAQIGYHQKPCGFLNTSGYYESLFQFMNHMVTEGFLKQLQLDKLMIDEESESLLKKMTFK